MRVHKALQSICSLRKRLQDFDNQPRWLIVELRRVPIALLVHPHDRALRRGPPPLREDAALLHKCGTLRIRILRLSVDRVVRVSQHVVVQLRDNLHRVRIHGTHIDLCAVDGDNKAVEMSVHAGKGLAAPVPHGPQHVVPRHPGGPQGAAALIKFQARHVVVKEQRLKPSADRRPRDVVDGLGKLEGVGDSLANKAPHRVHMTPEAELLFHERDGLRLPGRPRVVHLVKVLDPLL